MCPKSESGLLSLGTIDIFIQIVFVAVVGEGVRGEGGGGGVLYAVGVQQHSWSLLTRWQ